VKRLVRALAVGCVLALAVVLGWRLTHQPKTITKAVAKNRIVPAPNFTLPRLDTKGKLTLATLRGKAVVLNFWQSDCQPCKQEMPRLEAGWKKWDGKDVVIVGVDMLNTRAQGDAFFKRYGATYPMVWDELGDTVQPYGVWDTPETFFVDRRGRIVRHVLGPVSTKVLNADIETALTT